MQISKRTLRRMDNIGDICDFDTEKGVASLYLHFDKAEEIIDERKSTLAHPVIAAETIERMAKNMSVIPVEFKVAYAITIDDYQGYDPDQLLQAYKTGLENKYNRKDEADKSAHTAWFLFSMLGLGVLFLMVVGKHYGWFGAASSIAAMFMAGFLEIFFEIFFEESFIFYFIHLNSFDVFKESFRRLYALQCCDQNGKPLSRLDQKTLFED